MADKNIAKKEKAIEIMKKMDIYKPYISGFGSFCLRKSCTQQFSLVPLTSANLIFNAPTFTVLCTSACCPKKANTIREV